jgi:hypothetical protein
LRAKAALPPGLLICPALGEKFAFRFLGLARAYNNSFWQKWGNCTHQFLNQIQIQSHNVKLTTISPVNESDFLLSMPTIYDVGT